MSGSEPAWWLYLAIVLNFVVALRASIHIALNKRDDRAAAAWLAVVWLWPFAGAAGYWMFGVNRIARRAIRLRGPQNVEIPIHIIGLDRCHRHAPLDSALQRARLVKREIVVGLRAVPSSSTTRPKRGTTTSSGAA